MDVVAGAISRDPVLTVVPYVNGPEPAAVFSVDIDRDVLSKRGFEGKLGQAAMLETEQGSVLVVGLGERSELRLDSLRRMGATVARAASRVSSVDILIPDLGDAFSSQDIAQAITEGLVLGAYRFTEYKSQVDERALERVVLVDADASGVERGVRIASAVCLARDLANHPPITMTPSRLADVAREVAAREGLECEVLDEAAIEDERLGGLLGVSRGSSQPPRLVKLVYAPPQPRATLALVGKGITFDSGGISLKPPDAMVTMKTDMCGAAAVVAAMSVLPAFAPDVQVVAFVCLTENMPGPTAVKPGDVLRARNGKTIEVVNTDAEGRLVLADGLSLAVEQEVDAVVDIATLTGAIVVALGNEIAGLMANNDAFRAQVEAAAERAAEDVWHLPLPKRYRKHIDSEIADIKNMGAPKGSASAIAAGLFLQEFVDDTPWVHLDIAGTSRADGDDGYLTKGGTGYGVRTLIELVERFERPVVSNDM